MRISLRLTITTTLATLLNLASAAGTPGIASVESQLPDDVPLSACYRGGEEDVLVMVEDALQRILSRGARKAFAEFNNPHGRFVKGDIYLFVMDLNGTILAHGISPDSIGNNVFGISDASGHFFVQSILREIFTAGEARVDYLWLSPCTGSMAPKQVYCKRSGPYVICAGFYRHTDPGQR